MDEVKKEISSNVEAFQNQLGKLMQKYSVKGVFMGVTNELSDIDGKKNAAVIGGFAWSDVLGVTTPQIRALKLVYDQVGKELISDLGNNPFDKILGLVRDAAKRAGIDVDKIEKEIDDEDIDKPKKGYCDSCHMMHE